jgi:hypothetical protein
MGQREAAAEAARKEYALAQRDERSMQTNLRQTQMLEAQRQVALEQGKLNEVNAINDKLAQLGMEREQFRLTRGDKAFEQGAKQRELAVLEAGLKLRQDESKRGPTPSFQDQMARSAIEDWLKKNPTKTYSDAIEWWRGKRAGEESRAATMERYADNWEKLDVMQKNELAKQGVTNFQQYARMRDQMVAGNIGAAGAKTMTMADVQATAKSSGKTVDEVKKAAIAAGYTVQ